MELVSLIDRPQQLLEFIDNSLKPKEIEKKKFGEVFTPMSLCNQMLDKLPKSVWSNPDLTWFDPASGMGNFPIAVYLRLMVGLAEKIPSESKRKRHILENMLYVSELSRKNMLMYKQIMDIGNKYKMNLYCGDFLTFDSVKQFKLKSFDIVMGNPPYQDGSGSRGKNHTLWSKFLEIILDGVLKKNGYLVFVHPSLWRQADHPLLKLMLSRQIHYLEIHNEHDGKKTFDCATRYDWYVLRNRPYELETKIKDQDGIMHKIDLRGWPFIPNCRFEEIHKLLATGKDKGVDILYSRSGYASDKRWVTREKSSTNKYPAIYSVNRANEPTIFWSSINDRGHYGLSKVIFGSGATGFITDEKGKYALTQYAYGIVDKIENLPKILKALESPQFGDLIKAISVSTAEINRRALKYFKKDFYKYFQDKPLSKKENINSDDESLEKEL
jgi:hypothetical protein